MVTTTGTSVFLRTARSLRTAARVALVSALAVLVARSVVLAGRPVSNHDPVAAGGADPRGGATAPVRFIATADTRSDGENNGVNVEILGEIVVVQRVDLPV